MLLVLLCLTLLALFAYVHTLVSKNPILLLTRPTKTYDQNLHSLTFIRVRTALCFPTWSTTPDLHSINVLQKIQHNLISSFLHIQACNRLVIRKATNTNFFFIILWTLLGVKFLGGLTFFCEVTLPFDPQSKVFTSMTSDSVLSSRCPVFPRYFLATPYV